MKYVVAFFLCFQSFVLLAQTQVSVLSWNLRNFGKTKTEDQIAFIAATVKDYDLIAIQEVVAGYGGAQAVARLVAALNAQGNNWDYSISDPTSGTPYSTERYAFIWKKKRISKTGQAWLEQTYGMLIDREPYYARFKAGTASFTLVNFHAIPRKKQPETEIKYFKFLPARYPADHLIFCGDFNLPQSHTVFNPLRKMGYVPALTGQKTSLKQSSTNNDCLSKEFDNFYFLQQKLQVLKSGIIPFYTRFSDLKTARLLSDHVPVYMICSFQ